MEPKTMGIRRIIPDNGIYNGLFPGDDNGGLRYTIEVCGSQQSTRLDCVLINIKSGYW